MKTLILGLGNPILSDDGVGIYVARVLEDRVDPVKVTVTEASIAGLNLLDLIVGYDRAIIIDAIQTRKGKIGQVYQLKPAAFNIIHHSMTSHDVNLSTMLELGKRVGVVLPEITVFAIEVKDVTSFSEECTPEVSKAVSVCVEMVLQELERWSKNHL